MITDLVQSMLREVDNAPLRSTGAEEEDEEDEEGRPGGGVGNLLAYYAITGYKISLNVSNIYDPRG